jgi:hypothetical protein
MSLIQNLFTSRDNNANSATYVGQQGRLWYDTTMGLRVSDGNTPGGTPAVIATTSANIGNLVIFDTTISTIQANASINLVTNGVGNVKIVGAFVTANTAGGTIIETLQNGTVNFYVPTISNDSAIDIIGTADGNQLYPQNQGVLLHLTGQDSLPARIYSDGVNNYAAYIGRRYNGSPTAPTQVLAGQTISRYGGTPYSSSGWPTISTARVDFVALEDQTSANRGTSIELYTTPVGSANAIPSMMIAATGITNAANIVPVIDQGYNLGTPDLRWRNVYAGQGGLWIADNTTNAEVQLSVNAGTFFINGVQNIALGNLVINNATLETTTPNTNIYIGNVADTGYLQIDRTTQIVTQNLGNSAALLINGSLSNIVPTEYTNTLLHTINVPGYNSVTLYDNFGGNTNTFAGLQGRASRGTIQSPTNTQANDVLFQLSGSGYGNGFDTALGTQGGSRIDFRATETFTGSAKGSDIHFWTTQPGTTSTVNSGSIDYQGFSGNGFRFTTDNSVQTTAGIPLTQKANALGVATLDTNGYLSSSQIPPSLSGALTYQGSWNAANNTPTLVNGTGTVGSEYSIGVTGTQNLGGGSVTYQQGGFVIYGSGVWNYVPPSGLFTSLTANTHLSVNQPTGAITISVDATPSLVNSAIVSRDVNGSFAANVITATLSGSATSAGTAGTVTSNIQSAITQVGTLTSLSVTSNVNGGNLRTAGLISATGNITGGNLSVTGISGTLSTASQTNITSVGTLTSLSVTGNITGGNVTTGGTASAAGNITGGNVLTAGLMSATGNITGGNVLTTGLMSATGNITGGNVTTGGTASAAGNITGGNVLTTGLITATGTITSATTITGGNVTTGGLMSATGNITGGNVTTGGLITATGNITGGNVLTTGLITATGTITSATTITGGNVTTGGLMSATGNITGGNVLTAGQVSATGNISAGNLTIAASGTVTTPRVVFNNGGIRQLTGNTTVTLDFTTDSMVSLTNPTNTVTITLANYTAGAIIRFIYSSATARNINMGVAAAVNSTTGTANITGTGGGALYGANQSVILTYYCVGGTAATTYVSASYV